MSDVAPPMTDPLIGSSSTADMVTAIGEWVSREKLATPVGLFCHQAVADALRRLRGELNARISYAVKANTHPLMLQAVAGACEYNVTNLPHLRLLLSTGIDPADITWANPVVDETTAHHALSLGITRFVIDDERGLAVLTSRRPNLRLTLRLRPNRDGASPRSVVRFGALGDDLPDLGRKADAAGATVEALSFFIGTHGDDLASASPYRDALAQICSAQEKLAAQGIDVRQINIGGGFPGSRRRFHRDHPDFFERLDAALYASLPPGTEVICEPGRFLAEASIALLTKVVADRRTGGTRLTHLDAGGYAGLFETTFIDPGGAELNIATDRTGRRSTTQVIGPIMDSFDVVKRDAELPALADGDMLLLPNTGAYSFGYTAACEGTRTPHIVPLPGHLDSLVSTAWFA